VRHESDHVGYQKNYQNYQNYTVIGVRHDHDSMSYQNYTVIQQKTKNRRSENFHHLVMVNEEVLSGKRKRTLVSKLTSADNIHKDAVKRRKGLEKPTETPTKASTDKLPAAISQSSRQASIEVDDDEDVQIQHNAGRPKSPDSILEAADGSDDDVQYLRQSSVGAQHANKDSNEEGLQEETDEQELGDIYSSYLIHASLIAFQPASKRTGDLPSMPSFAQRWKSSMSMDVVSTTLPAQLKIARGKGGILEWFAVTSILATKAQAVVYAVTQYSAGGRK